MHFGLISVDIAPLIHYSEIMNDDLYDLLKNYAYQSSVKMTTQQVYDMLHYLEIYSKEDTEMGYTFNRGYQYNDTRGDEVATATLEAYAKGISFEALLKKNTQVRIYWSQIQSERAAKEKQRIKEQERLARLAEKRAIEKAKKDEVLAKLTDEELEAFGFMKNKKVTKR